MKIKKSARFGVSTLVSLLSLLAFSAPAVFAVPDTCTWTGAGDHITFSDATNWSNCSSAAPVTGDSLVFDNSSLGTNTSLVDDISGVSFVDVTFQGTGASAFVITPATSEVLQVSGNIADTTAISAGTGATIDLPISFLGPTQTISTSDFLQFGSGTESLAMTLGTSNVTFSSANGAEIDNFDVITGTGSITTNMSATGLYLQGNASPAFTGSVTVQSGMLDQQATSGNPDQFAGVSLLTVDSGATAEYESDNATTGTIAEPLNVNGTGVASTQCSGLNAGTGVNCGAVLATMAAGSNLTFTGAVTLAATSQFNSNGTITLTGPLSGAFKVTNAVGTLVVNSSSNTSNTANGTYAPSSGSSSGSTKKKSSTSVPGTPDTGLAAVVGNPFGVLVLTFAAAGSLLIAAKKLNLAKH